MSGVSTSLSFVRQGLRHVTDPELLTPRQVALALGVSESSLKRWCDRGLLRAIKTAGGHRRVPLASVLEYLRDSGTTPVDAAALGLPPLHRASDPTKHAAEELVRGLLEGNESFCRQLISKLIVGGASLAKLCDDVISPAFQHIGERWACGEVQVYQERSACEVMQRVIYQLRREWSNATADAPLAIGGTLPEDQYRLPTSLIELVLLQQGWNARSLGTNLTVETLEDAIRQHQPALAWVSVSYIPESARLRNQLDELAAICSETGTRLALGGHALSSEMERELVPPTFFPTMSAFAEFAAADKQRIQNQHVSAPC